MPEGYTHALAAAWREWAAVHRKLAKRCATLDFAGLLKPLGVAF